MSQSDAPQTPEEAGKMHATDELENDPADEDFPFDVDPETRYLAGAFQGVVETLNDQNAIMRQLTANIDENTSVLKGAAEAGEQASQSDGDDPDGTDTSVTVEHDYDGSVLVDKMVSWLDAASNFHSDLKPEWCDVEFGQVDGNVGCIIDAGNPWEHNQVTDANAPNDRWKDHQEALKKTTQSEDAVVYHGEPAWFNFLPADSVQEVVE